MRIDNNSVFLQCEKSNIDFNESYNLFINGLLLREYKKV